MALTTATESHKLQRVYVCTSPRRMAIVIRGRTDALVPGIRSGNSERTHGYSTKAKIPTRLERGNERAATAPLHYPFMFNCGGCFAGQLPFFGRSRNACASRPQTARGVRRAWGAVDAPRVAGGAAGAVAPAGPMTWRITIIISYAHSAAGC